MKHELIMENWRRFQNEQDDRLIVEGKRKSFESLMLEVDQGHLSCVTVAIALSEQVDRQIALLEKQLNENFLKKLGSKALNSFSNFATKSLEKVAKLSLTASSKTAKKIIKIGSGIANKIASVSRKLFEKGSFAIAHTLRFAAMICLSMLAFTSLAHGGISIDTLQNAKANTVQPVAELAVNIDFTTDGEESYLMDYDATGEPIDVEGESGKTLKVKQIGEKSDKLILDSAELFDGLIAMAERSGGEITQDQFQKQLDNAQAEVALTVDDAVKFSMEIQQEVDPEGVAVGAEDAKKMMTTYNSFIDNFVIKTGDAVGVKGGLNSFEQGQKTRTTRSLNVPSK
jgi:hypothetical protein